MHERRGRGQTTLVYTCEIEGCEPAQADERSAVGARHLEIFHTKPLHQPFASTRVRGEGSASTPLHQPSGSTSVADHTEAQVMSTGIDEGVRTHGGHGRYT